MKGNKGITLIALVITIIVLLILAGVSIAMLSGQNSILGRASDSSVKTSIASAKEQVSNLINEAITEYYNSVYVEGNSTTSSQKDPIQTYVWNYLIDSSRLGAADKTKIYDQITVDVSTVNTVVLKYTGDTTKYVTGVIDTDGKVTWTPTGVTGI